MPDQHERDQLREKERLERIRAKMNVQHPHYPWLRVDARTTREVAETRSVKGEHIRRLSKRANASRKAAQHQENQNAARMVHAAKANHPQRNPNWAGVRGPDQACAVNIKRDSDGAYRIANRIDGGKAMEKVA